MTLQQLKCLCEVVDQHLNLSRAARALHTSQPAITKMVRKLESELDVQLLVRAGPRIAAITDEGQQVVAFARVVLQNVRDLRLAASDTRDSNKGLLHIATTSLQARYALADAIQRFAHKYAEVDIEISQGTPVEILDWVAVGKVNLGISPLPALLPKNVKKLYAYPIKRCIIAPRGHPLLRHKKPTLSQVAMHRLISYSTQFDMGAAVRKVFDDAKILPRIAIRAANVDLVKSYVGVGLGIGIIQAMTFNPDHDKLLRAVDASHLFPASTAWITLREDQYLRRFMYDFIEMVAPKWTRAEVDRELCLKVVDDVK